MMIGEVCFFNSGKSCGAKIIRLCFSSLCCSCWATRI